MTGPTLKVDLGAGYREYFLLMALREGDALLQEDDGRLHWIKVRDPYLLHQYQQALAVQRWMNHDT